MMNFAGSGKLDEYFIKYLCSDQYTVRQMGAVGNRYTHVGNGHCRGSGGEMVNGRSLNAVGAAECETACDAQDNCLAYDHRLLDGRCQLYGPGLDDKLPSGRRFDECPFVIGTVTSDSGSCTSASTCTSLGWTAGGGSAQVCAASMLAHDGQNVVTAACFGGTSSTVAGIGHAEAICHAVGARLCTVDELIADEGKEGTATSCFDLEQVWTSTACTGGSVSIQGNGDGNRVCQTDLSENLGVLCCGDAVVATPCASPHPCLSTASGTATLNSHADVSFPPHAGSYSHNLDCKWLLTCSSGLPLVSVHTLSTQSASDYVNVFDGSTTGATSLSQLHGDPAAPTIVSGTTTDVLIQFTSDGASASSGFVFSFTCRGGDALDEQVGVVDTRGECSDLVQSNRPEAVGAAYFGTSCWAQFEEDTSLWTGMAVQTCNFPDGTQSALVFDGDDSISIVRARVPTGTNSRTLAVWYKPDCTAGGAARRAIVSWGGGSNVEKGFAAMHTDACASTDLYVGDSPSPQPTAGAGPIDGWNHVVFTVAGDGTMNMYQGGRWVSPTQSVTGMETGAMNDQHPLIIGARLDGTGTHVDWFVGMIQRVRVWETALTAPAVLAEYANGGGMVSEGLVVDLTAVTSRWGGEMADSFDATRARSVPLINAARAAGASASQSSTMLSGVAGRAVDGDTSSDYNLNSCSHTVAGAVEWWQVDLGGAYDISSVEIYHRTGCSADCDAALLGAQVFASMTADYSSGIVCGTLGNNLAIPDILDCTQSARFVTVVQSSSQAITICEMKVMAFPLVEAALNKATSQTAASMPAAPVETCSGNVATCLAIDQAACTADTRCAWSGSSCQPTGAPCTDSSDQCSGGAILTDSGTFTHVPGASNDNHDCVWVLTCTTGNPVVRFTSFSTESGFDSVKFYPLVSAPGTPFRSSATDTTWVTGNVATDTLSGDVLPAPLTAGGQRAVIRFMSDSAITSSGFSGSFSCGVDAAVDGSTASDLAVELLTSGMAWWQVDLGADYKVSAVEVYSSATATPTTDGASIYVSTTDDYTTTGVDCGATGSDASIRPSIVLCAARTARYVTLQKDFTGQGVSSMAIGEVKVKVVPTNQVLAYVGVELQGHTDTRRAAASEGSAGLMEEWMGYPQPVYQVGSSNVRAAPGVVCKIRSTERQQPPIFCQFDNVNDYNETAHNAGKKCGATYSSTGYTAAATAGYLNLVNVGVSHCTASAQCAACTGDCDSDGDCQTGLVCHHRNPGGATPPGCTHGGAGDVSGYDYCVVVGMPALCAPVYKNRCEAVTTNDNGECTGITHDTDTTSFPLVCAWDGRVCTAIHDTSGGRSGDFAVGNAVEGLRTPLPKDDHADAVWYTAVVTGIHALGAEYTVRWQDNLRHSRRVAATKLRLPASVTGAESKHCVDASTQATCEAIGHATVAAPGLCAWIPAGPPNLRGFSTWSALPGTVITALDTVNDIAGTAVHLRGAPLANGRSTSDAGCTVAGGCHVQVFCKPPQKSGIGACEVCRENYYKDSNSGAGCERCPAHSGTRGVVACEHVSECWCGMGFEGVLVDLDSVCTACLPGMYKSDLGPRPCMACPANSNTWHKGNGLQSNVAESVAEWDARLSNATLLSDCTCDPGYTGTSSQTPASNCQACPANDYKEVAGANACLDCGPQATTLPAGFNADATRTSALQIHRIYRSDCKCKPGWTGDMSDAAISCTRCAVNKYKHLDGPNDCFDCPPYSETKIDNQVVLPGDTASPLLNPSRIGADSTAGIFGTPSADGTYAPVRSIAIATRDARSDIAQCRCMPGYSGLLTLAVPNCTVCQPSTYKETFGDATCDSCVAGSSTLGLNGSYLVSQCFCNRGYKGPGSKEGTSVVRGIVVSGTTPALQTFNNNNNIPATIVARQASTASVGTPPSVYPVDAGLLTTATHTCTACSRDFVKASDGPGDCLACVDLSDNSGTAGTASNERGDCMCGDGYFGNLTIDGVTCRQCDSDKYKYLPGHHDCTNCPANSGTAGAIGQISITDCLCDPGYTGTLTNGSSVCVACPANTYKTFAGGGICSHCDPYSVASDRSTSVSDCFCGPGYYGGSVLDPTAAVLQQCDNIADEPTCTAQTGACQWTAGDCEAIPFVPQGWTTCKDNDMALGYPGFCSAGGADRTHGYAHTHYTGFLTSSTDRCLECGAGFFKSVTGAQPCTRCTPNSDTNGLDTRTAVGSCLCAAGLRGLLTSTDTTTFQGRCTPCSPDTFNPLIGQGSCEICPSFSGTSGAYYSDSVQDCTCQAGFDKNATGFCELCVSGKYKSTAGNASCTSCVANAGTGYVPFPSDHADYLQIHVIGATNATNCSCSPGYTGRITSPTSVCSMCSMGRFKAYYGDSGCVPCGIGTRAQAFNYVGGEAPDTPQVCACGPGFEMLAGPADALVVCTECAPSKYKSALSSAEMCLDCPANSNTMGYPGMNSSLSCVCNPGFTGPAGGPCVGCPSGRYKELIGAAGCLTCPAFAGTHGTVQGQPADLLTKCWCNRGYTGAITIPTDQCEECASDYYKSSNGESICGACPANSWTNGNRAVGNLRDCFCVEGYVNSGGYRASNGTWMRGPGMCIVCTEDSIDPGCRVYPPNVNILPIVGNVSKVNPSARFSLDATVDPGTRLDWAAWNRTSVQEPYGRFFMDQPFLFPNTGVAEPFLIIASGQLVPGTMYRIRLTATWKRPDENGILVDIAGSSEIEFGVNTFPASGGLTVAPQMGEALDTFFVARAPNWVDEDQPLAYAFGFLQQSDDTTNWLSGATSSDTYTTALPQGTLGVNDTCFLDMVVRVVDAYGATINHTAPVDVRPWIPSGGTLVDQLSDKLSGLQNGTQVASTVGTMAVILNANASHVENGSAVQAGMTLARASMAEYLAASVSETAQLDATSIAVFSAAAASVTAVPNQISLECMDSVTDALEGVVHTTPMEEETANAVSSALSNMFVALDKPCPAGVCGTGVSPSVARVPRIMGVLGKVSIGIAARLVAGEPPETITMPKFAMEVQKFTKANSNGTKLAGGRMTMPALDFSQLNGSQWINRTTASALSSDLSSQAIVWDNGFNPFAFGGKQPTGKGFGKTLELSSEVFSFSLYSNGSEVVVKDLPEHFIVNISLHPTAYTQVLDNCGDVKCINAYDVQHGEGACDSLLGRGGGEGRYSCEANFCVGCDLEHFCDLSCRPDCTHTRDCVGPLYEPVNARNRTECLTTGHRWYPQIDKLCTSLSGAPTTEYHQWSEGNCTGDRLWVDNPDPDAKVCMETSSQLILFGMGQDPGAVDGHRKFINEHGVTTNRMGVDRNRYYPITNAASCAEKIANHHADNCGALIGSGSFERCEYGDVCVSPTGATNATDIAACAAARLAGLDFRGLAASDRQIACVSTPQSVGSSCMYKPRGTACVPRGTCTALSEWNHPLKMCHTKSGANAEKARRITTESECQKGNRWRAAEAEVCRGSLGRPIPAGTNQTECELSKNRWFPPEKRANLLATLDAAYQSALNDANTTNVSAADFAGPSFVCTLPPEATCTYWDPTAARWRRDGVIIERTQTYMLCGFRHLTDFGSMLGAPRQAAKLGSMMETFALQNWASSTIGFYIAAVLLAGALLCNIGSLGNHITGMSKRQRMSVKDHATKEEKGNFADAILALKGIPAKWKNHTHTWTMIRTNWDLAALVMPIKGDPMSRMQRFIIIVIGVLCTMAVEIMFYKSPVFPSMDVCEGPNDAQGMSTNCSAATMDEQMAECTCKTFFTTDGCDHCADGPFEGSTSRVGPQGALQNCTDNCVEHISSQSSAMILTVVIMKLISLLIYELFQYLHHPFLAMLDLEGKKVRKGDQGVRVKILSKNKMKRGQTETNILGKLGMGEQLNDEEVLSFHLNPGTHQNNQKPEVKEEETESLQVRTHRALDKVKLGVALGGGVQGFRAQRVKKSAELEKKMQEGKQVWYTTETGSHIPTTPKLRTKALKMLQDKRKQTIIGVLLKKSAMNKQNKQRLTKEKKKMRAMSLPKLKQKALRELSAMSDKYAIEVEDALDLVRDIPDYSPQLDDSAARTKRQILLVYLIMGGVGSGCVYFIMVQATKLSAELTMKWLYGCAVSVCIQLFLVQPLWTLGVGHMRRRWSNLHKGEQIGDELRFNLRDRQSAPKVTEEERLEKDKVAIQRGADDIQLAKADVTEDEKAFITSKWAVAQTNISTVAKVGGAFKAALARAQTKANAENGGADPLDLTDLGMTGASGSERLAATMAARKAAKTMAKRKKALAASAQKLASLADSLADTQAELMTNAANDFKEWKDTAIMDKQIADRQDCHEDEEEELGVHLDDAMKRFNKLMKRFTADVQMVSSGQTVAKELHELEDQDPSMELIEMGLTFDAIADAYDERAKQIVKDLKVDQGTLLETTVQEKVREQKALMHTKVSRLEDLLASYEPQLDELVEQGAEMDIVDSDDDVPPLPSGWRRLNAAAALGVGGMIPPTDSLAAVAEDDEHDLDVEALEEVSLRTGVRDSITESPIVPPRPMPRPPPGGRPTEGTGRFQGRDTSVVLESSPVNVKPMPDLDISSIAKSDEVSAATGVGTEEVEAGSDEYEMEEIM